MLSLGVVSAFRDGLVAQNKGTSIVKELKALSAAQETALLLATVVFLNLLIVLGCLKFMRDVRHPKALKNRLVSVLREVQETSRLA
jgi:flagellar biogenesis protein FliO